jgi:hypothetical protein
MAPPDASPRKGDDPGPLPYLTRGIEALVGVFLLPLTVLAEAKRLETEARKPINKDAAHPTRKPTPAQIAEINGHIKARRYQQALDKTVEYYGIDTSNVNGKITYDPKVTSGGSTSPDRKVRFGTGTFTLSDSGAAYTATSIIHEVSHANAVKLHGHPDDKPADKTTQEWMAFEAMAYQAEVTHADEIGLSKERKELTQNRLDDHLKALTPLNRKLVENGQYWDMKSDSER